MGLTKDKLLNTVQHYKNLLNKEKEQFAVALKNQIANNIDAKALEINRLQERTEENKRKIQQLMDEQIIIESEIAKLRESAELSKSKIEDTRDQFKNTFDILYAEIEEDGSLYDRIFFIFTNQNINKWQIFQVQKSNPNLFGKNRKELQGRYFSRQL